MPSRNKLFNFQNTYSQLPPVLYSKGNPDPVSQPELVVFNRQLAAEMGLGSDQNNEELLAEVLAGNQLPGGSEPLSQAYAGHQFGGFTKLGDGRAVLLGEHITPDGKRFDIQLKGAGVTPFSRGGDGRGTLSSMLREYLMSEALHALGVPTSRALAVTATGDQVYRQTAEPGGILTRVASSHIRVGTFEYAAYFTDKKTLQSLLEYTVNRHYPELKGEKNLPLPFFKKVVDVQLKLVTEWMRIGFIHGVMNTDNTTISGETIDYGPCAFMNIYDPKTVFSSIDTGGRYSFGNQPSILQWNLAVLAQTLLTLTEVNSQKAFEEFKAVIEEVPVRYEQMRFEMYARKLGISNPQKQDKLLIESLLDYMKKHGADYTHTFLALRIGEFEGETLFESSDFREWYMRYTERLKQNPGGVEEAREMMGASNPAVIPRNNVVEQVLEKAVEGDMKSFRDFLEVLSDPYVFDEGHGKYRKVPSDFDAGYQTFCGT